MMRGLVMDNDDEGATVPAFEWPTVNGVQEPTDLRNAVGMAGGAFSMCWDDVHNAGVFLSEQAVAIVDGLVKWIEENYVPR